MRTASNKVGSNNKCAEQGRGSGATARLVLLVLFLLVFITLVLVASLVAGAPPTSSGRCRGSVGVVTAVPELAVTPGKVCAGNFAASVNFRWDLPDLLLPELDPLEEEPEDLAGEAEPPLRLGLPFEPL